MVFGGRKPKLVVRGDKGKKHETLRFQTFRRILLLLFSYESLDLFVWKRKHSLILYVTKYRKMSSRNSQIIILLFSFQKVLFKNDIFRYIFARVDVESNQSCQSRRERPIKTSWPEKSGATRNHLWSRLSLSFTRQRAQKLNLFCLESYEQDWARGIIVLNYIKLAKRVDICDKIASISSYKML